MAGKWKMTLREWQNCIKPTDEYIIQASCTDGSDGWTEFPIGMGYGYMTLDKDDRMINGKHNKLVYNNFSLHTDKKRRNFSSVTRESTALLLEENGIRFQQPVNFRVYYHMLPSYKFVISPEGNGIDCHRHYEALMAGCIPVIEDNHLVREKYKGCPILYTEDYSEINEEYLEEKYNKMIDKEYDFSMLSISNYTLKQQEEIKRNGNYWCLRLAGLEAYPRL